MRPVGLPVSLRMEVSKGGGLSHVGKTDVKGSVRDIKGQGSQREKGNISLGGEIWEGFVEECHWVQVSEVGRSLASREGREGRSRWKEWRRQRQGGGRTGGQHVWVLLKVLEILWEQSLFCGTLIFVRVKVAGFCPGGSAVPPPQTLSSPECRPF